jgi:RNA polymerase sigma-70 factor, ECF subfamily
VEHPCREPGGHRVRPPGRAERRGAGVPARRRVDPQVEESDETLMARAGAGDRDACGTLVTRHLARIVAFAARVLGDRNAAEDVAQEVFLRLWTHAGRWQPGRARLGTWLHRVALNLCLDRLARRREGSLDDAGEPPDPRLSGTALAEARDLGRHVNGELMALPSQQRIAITLCHYQGFSNLEAAELLEVSVEALESLLARGRRTLRARLRDRVPALLRGEER